MGLIELKPRAIAGGLALIVTCAVVGMVTVPYAAWSGDSLVKLVALPAALVLLFFLVLDKTKLFLLIILIRAPIDPLLEASKFAPFLSLGAVFNALVILIVFLLILERPRIVARTALPIWAPLILIALIETARSPDFVPAVRMFLSFLSYAAVFTAPFYLKECQKDARFCIGLVLLSSLVPALYGFWDFAHGGQGGALGGRIQASFSHPNIFAFYLVLVISLTFYLIKSTSTTLSWIQRCALAVYIALLLVLLILTKTRSAWAAALVIFLVYGLIFERRYVIYLAAGTCLALLVPDVRDRLLDVYYVSAFAQTQNSYEWRKILWESAWNWMQWKNMVLGYGLASFPYYSLEFYASANGLKWSAHSVYVQWFFEAGIVGVLSSAWLFLRFPSVLWKAMRVDKLWTFMVLTITLEYLVVSYSDNMLDYLTYNWYFWFVIGTACAVATGRKPNSQQPASGSDVGETSRRLVARNVTAGKGRFA